MSESYSHTQEKLPNQARGAWDRELDSMLQSGMIDLPTQSFARFATEAQAREAGKATTRFHVILKACGGDLYNPSGAKKASHEEAARKQRVDTATQLFTEQIILQRPQVILEIVTYLQDGDAGPNEAPFGLLTQELNKTWPDLLSKFQEGALLEIEIETIARDARWNSICNQIEFLRKKRDNQEHGQAKKFSFVGISVPLFFDECEQIGSSDAEEQSRKPQTPLVTFIESLVNKIAQSEGATTIDVVLRTEVVKSDVATHKEQFNDLCKKSFGPPMTDVVVNMGHLEHLQ